MPLAGWMLVKDRGLGAQWLLLAAFCGALGNLLGSLLAYYVGAWGGRPLVLPLRALPAHLPPRPGRWPSAGSTRYGEWTVFFSRLLPVVRTFISVPAGVARMPIWRFSAYTFAGSFPWSLGLAWAGFLLGENWERIRNWMRPADIPIVVVVLLLIGLYVYRHVRRAWTEEPETQGSKVQEGR